MSLESTFAGLASNKYQLWLAGELAAITEVRTYDTGLKTVAVLLAGGRAPAPWPEMWEEIERQAKIAGCARAEMAGRRGWLRVLRGWRQTTIDMEKELV